MRLCVTGGDDGDVVQPDGEKWDGEVFLRVVCVSR